MAILKNLLLLGLSHATADALAGFAIVSFSGQHSLLRLSLVILTYNVVAFALQPFIGLIVDRQQNHPQALVASLALMCAGGLFFSASGLLGLLFIATGSALFHVSAGALSCQLTPQKNYGAAIFTAPGVVGLALGTAAALMHLAFLLPLVIALAALAFVTQSQRWTPSVDAPQAKVKRYSWLVITIALVLIGLRSGVWLASTSEATGVSAIILIGLCAGAGKLAGGFAADRWGRAPIVLIGAVLAVIFLRTESFGPLLLGVFCLQSSTPLALAWLVNQFPRRPATVAGLVLGSAIVVGGAFVY